MFLLFFESDFVTGVSKDLRLFGFTLIDTELDLLLLLWDSRKKSCIPNFLAYRYNLGGKN